MGIAGWRGAKSLYNHRHPNVLDTQVPCVADRTVSTSGTGRRPTRWNTISGSKGISTSKSSPYTADSAVHEVRLSR